jgi:hypothetical protein
LFEFEMSVHLAKIRFMSYYLVWHQHGEVQPLIAAEPDENDDGIRWMTW